MKLWSVIKLRRPLFFLVLFLVSAGALAADGESTRYKGRTVMSVIDDFRSQGFGLTYSTILVSDRLLVTIEPTATDELQIVRQILEPHNLTIRSEEGLWLIVRGDQGSQQTGDVLLIVRDKRDYMPLQQPTVNAVPAFTRASILAPGIQQYSELKPGSYRVEV